MPRQRYRPPSRVKNFFQRIRRGKEDFARFCEEEGAVFAFLDEESNASLYRG